MEIITAVGTEDLGHQKPGKISNAMSPVDYLEKFGPMLHLLDSEKDFDFLASEEGYDAEIAHSYRTVRYQALQGYRQDLLADFEHLYSVASPSALTNPDLARLLATTRKSLVRSVRYIGFRMRLELILPSPAATTRPSAFRRLLVRAIPRQRAPYQLLLGRLSGR